MADHILLEDEAIVKPVTKRRKVITSDDENSPDDGPSAIPSKIPQKETKKSTKAQSKLTGKRASQALENSSKKVLAVEPADVEDDGVSDEEELAVASTT